jgi:hypothetical protein
MANRKDLQEELNRINQLYQETDLEMRKAGGSTEQRQKLRDLLNSKKERLMKEMGDDLQKLNVGEGIRISKGTDAAGSAAKLGRFKKTLGSLGKKAAGIIPLAGVGMAALSGDPAMAAEELASDAAGPAGIAYDAIKPEIAGNRDEERQMLAERDAMEKYKKSPARLDKLKKLMGGQ